MSLPPQTARHALMLAKTIWRDALTYGVTETNPTGKLRTPSVQVAPRKFLTWEEGDAIDWGEYDS